MKYTYFKGGNTKLLTCLWLSNLRKAWRPRLPCADRVEGLAWDEFPLSGSPAPGICILHFLQRTVT